MSSLGFVILAAVLVRNAPTHILVICVKEMVFTQGAMALGGASAITAGCQTAMRCSHACAKMASSRKTTFARLAAISLRTVINV